MYEWAGTTRGERTTIEGQIFQPPPLLMKGTSTFLPANHIERAIGQLAEELASRDFLRDLPREGFAREAADVFVRLNAAHPFRQGNGRTQREFISQLAEGAGHALDFQVVSSERMIVASFDGLHGDASTMRRLFDEISDPRRTALLHEAVRIMEREGVAWRELYVASARSDFEYTGRLAVFSKDVFILESSGDVIVGQGRDVTDDMKEAGGRAVRVMTSAYGEAGSSVHHRQQDLEL